MGNDKDPGRSNYEKLEARLQQARNLSLPDLLESLTIMREELKLLGDRIQILEARFKDSGVKERWNSLWYIAPLIIAVVFTGYLVSLGWAEKPDVSIEFNVGEIIGGSLAGVGALLAAVAYAFGWTRGKG